MFLVRFTAGRRRYLVQFGTMIQVERYASPTVHYDSL